MNHLTGRPFMYGVKDFDVFYFDGTDLSYQAEDIAIQRLERRFDHLPAPVELRNQARVHLWFEKKFGYAFLPLQSAEEMLGRFASKTHAVGIRLSVGGDFEIFMPFGLDDLFSFRIAPNHAIENRLTYEVKGARAFMHVT